MKTEKFRENTSDTIKEIFEQSNGTMPPTLRVLFSNGSTEFVALPSFLVASNKGKDLLVDYVIPAILRTLREEGKKISCIALATDSYVTKVKEKEVEHLAFDEILPFTRKQGIQRKEALCIVYYTYQSTFNDVFIYGRKDGKIVFTERMDTTAEMDTRSRFANLLQANPRDN